MNLGPAETNPLANGTERANPGCFPCCMERSERRELISTWPAEWRVSS